MAKNWDSDEPSIAAMADPSDQYMKSLEVIEKFEEIKKLTKEL